MANINRFLTAKEIINTAAVEVGLTAVEDPVGSSDPAFKQLTQLLTSCGRELVTKCEWQQLVREHAFTTTTDTEYDLPEDFAYMIDQSGWELDSSNPLGGPLNSQLWTRVIGGGFSVTSVSLSFRIAQGQIWVFPQPPTAGLDVTFEYISLCWIWQGGDDTVRADNITMNSDVVLFPNILISKMLKYRFLAAKGFDVREARQEYTEALDSWTSRDKPAPVLSLTGSKSTRFLDWDNVPESGYGQ